MRALHTAATGMMAQELNVQVISNNIANMRTIETVYLGGKKFE